MRNIGLIGGMSWESTAQYYRLINEMVKTRMGGFHSARLILYSVDFYEIERLQHAGDWAGAGAILAQVARSLQAGGADFVVLCTNTMHKLADAIEGAVEIPFLHIVDALAEEIKQSGMTKVGLLGTRFTMEQAFYKDRLHEQHGIDVVIPHDADREIVHRIIFEELCMGNILDKSRTEYRRIIQQLVESGAQGVILGCTEISMLIGAEDSPVPVFDTTLIHARKAVDWALQDDCAASDKQPQSAFT